MMDGKIDDIRLRLDNIGEELADLALEALRQAMEQGAQKRPAAERTLTQARRAVVKAAQLLDNEKLSL